MKSKKFYEAVATLMGCVLGAGILGIPYVVSRSGFSIGLFWILGLGFAVLLINLYMGEIVLRTKGFHQLTGYAEKYLGRKGRFFMTISMMIGIYGALLAYIIGVGNALYAMFPYFTAFQYGLMFFVAVTAFVLIGLKAIEKLEIWMGVGIILVVFLIAGYLMFSRYFSFSNLLTVSYGNFLLPYGVVLFAYLGTAAIPEMHEELFKDKKLFKRAILVGSILPIILYFIFTFVVVGTTGFATTEVATIGLGMLLGRFMVIFGNLFAILAMTTSFLSLGLALKEMYYYDFKLNEVGSLSLSVIVPLALFFIGVKDFILVLEFAGSIAAALAGVLIVLMHWRCKQMGNRKPEFVVKRNYVIGGLLIALFIFGIIHQILLFF